MTDGSSVSTMTRPAAVTSRPRPGPGSMNISAPFIQRPDRDVAVGGGPLDRWNGGVLAIARRAAAARSTSPPFRSLRVSPVQAQRRSRLRLQRLSNGDSVASPA